MGLSSVSGRPLWLLSLIVTILALIPHPALSWGIVGHQIIATIAQTQLHPLVREHLCSILPNNTAYSSPYPNDGQEHKHCHLAPYAAWADAIRGSYPWASRLHYVNPLHDEPPSHCTYGEDGWASDQNVLSAITNYTAILRDAPHGSYTRDTALRFLTHFVGDMHQPLHLTGRARGGNDVWVTFEGRRARLHSVWDSLIINSQVRSLANYTAPLPNARIESALRGTIYDNYVRWIMQEGLGQGARNGPEGWWKEESDDWPACPERQQRAPHRLAGAALWLKPLAPHTSRALRSFSLLMSPKSQRKPAPTDVDDTDLPVCPMAWSKPMHPLVCEYAFASPVPDVEEPHEPSSTYSDRTWPPAPELDVPEYLGRITDQHIVERQLARGGVRLAAILNSLLLPEAQKLAAAAPSIAASAEFISFPTLKSHLRTFDAPISATRNKHSGKGRGAPILDLVKVTASSIMEVVMLSTVGYILARRGVIDKRTQTKINKLNVSCFTPALLFSKVAFTLNPARLAELSIVPLGFVIVTLTSSLVAWGLASAARLTRAQRNFSIACAMSPNSNSLPVALMQSLVATVPQLHWEEPGEPEDTVNGMLGRALTYLVLFSTLGMLTRWSIGARLLASVDEEEEAESAAPVIASPTQEEPGRLSARIANRSATAPAPPLRRSSSTHREAPDVIGAEDDEHNPFERRPSRSRSGPPAWVRSFPNTPGEDEETVADEEWGDSASSAAARRQALDRADSGASHSAFASFLRRVGAGVKRVFRTVVVTPLRVVNSFMTAPLYAAVISLIVAMIRPLQVAIGSIEPLVGALETAGACSIPLTMVVLGAYFVEEKEEPVKNGNAVAPPIVVQEPASSAQSTLVGTATTQSRNNKRGSLPFMKNPWKRGSGDEEGSSSNGWSAAPSEAGATEEGEYDDDERTNLNGAWSNTNANAGSNNGGGSWVPAMLRRRRSSTMTELERRKRAKAAQERRTIIVSICSRMIVTPILLLPLLAWYALKTSYNVVDDPVFITAAALIIGSPPALTLAQITTQSATGDSGFERLISKTIFVSYAVLAAPTTVLLVLFSLLVAESEPIHPRGFGL